MVPVQQLRKHAPGTILLLLYGFLSLLMLGIVLQYLPAGTDTAFLGIKQDYINIPFYLIAFYIHVFTAILALPAGATQFAPAIRRQYPQVHRINGRLYVGAILMLGGPSGFYIGLFANGGLPSRISFCLLALLWIGCTLQAYRKARSGDLSAHKAFMYRSFALTLSALTLRAWKVALVPLFHPHPMDLYRIIAWLGWIPNLLIAEYLIAKMKRT